MNKNLLKMLSSRWLTVVVAVVAFSNVAILYGFIKWKLLVASVLR